MTAITLFVATINDWTSFHAASAEALGFPEFYGQNNNAWVDCLSYLTDDDGMCKVVLCGDERLFLHLPEFKEFQKQHPTIAAALIDCAATVNARYIANGDIPRLVLIPQ